MKFKIFMVAMVWGCLGVVPGSWNIARGQFLDAVLDGIKKSTESSERDNSINVKHKEKWSESDDGERHGRRDGETHRNMHSREANDPDVIVKRAYEDVLNREPDKAGLRIYRSHIIDDNWTEQDVRKSLRDSAEYKGRTPESAAVIVRRAYQDVLGREPDQEGLSTYRDKLVNEGWTERDVRSDLKKSSERRETGGISSEEAQKMVKRAYQSVLGRDPDSSGMALYVQKIRQNRWSEADVAKELRNSSEYRKKHDKK